jgi:hypothetical protein
MSFIFDLPQLSRNAAARLVHTTQFRSFVRAQSRRWIILIW